MRCKGNCRSTGFAVWESCAARNFQRKSRCRLAVSEPAREAASAQTRSAVQFRAARADLQIRLYLDSRIQDIAVNSKQRLCRCVRDGQTLEARFGGRLVHSQNWRRERLRKCAS